MIGSIGHFDLGQLTDHNIPNVQELRIGPIKEANLHTLNAFPGIKVLHIEVMPYQPLPRIATPKTLEYIECVHFRNITYQEPEFTPSIVNSMVSSMFQNIPNLKLVAASDCTSDINQEASAGAFNIFIGDEDAVWKKISEEIGLEVFLHHLS